MPLEVSWLGRQAYGPALELQEKAIDARRAGSAGDRLLLLEHSPVVTLGRSSHEANLLLSREALAARGIEVHEVARGGDVTWHGPGQLIGYLVLDLDARGERDVHRLLRRIEQGLIDALRGFGIVGEPREGMTGVFVAGTRPPRKIASIGVGLRGWISYHGFALNVTNAPEDFSVIVPCGLEGVEMTSMVREPGVPAGEVPFERVREAVADAFRAEFG